MSKNDSVAATRLSPAAKDALGKEASTAGISVSLMLRRIVTTELRKRWHIDDAKV